MTEHGPRLRALDAFIAEYEAEHGEITEAEMAEAEREARERAIVVRGSERSVDRPVSAAASETYLRSFRSREDVWSGDHGHGMTGATEPQVKRAGGVSRGNFGL